MLAKTKWLGVVCLGLLVLALSAGPVIAQQKMKYQGKRFGVITDRTMQEVGDVKGHLIGLVESEGVDVSAKTTWRSFSLFDGVMPKGGTFEGRTVTMYPNGDKVFGQFQGSMEGKPGPDGKPMMLMQGTWKFTSGTGKWNGVQGSGTFKGHYLSNSIYTYDLDGEYTLKK